MTPEAQRIAIAEACGYTQITIKELRAFPPEHLIDRSKTIERVVIPNYLTDLNAMHKAEGIFDNCEVKWKVYRDWLLSIVEPHRHEINATAAQRAEAFLRTIGKWIE